MPVLVVMPPVHDDPMCLMSGTGESEYGAERARERGETWVPMTRGQLCTTQHTTIIMASAAQVWSPRYSQGIRIVTT